MQKRIGYQGVKGAFSYLEAVKRFGENNLFIGRGSFREVFEDLQEGRTDAALLPIENSLAGSIHEVYDLLYQYSFTINGESYRLIEHCLLGLGKLEDIQKVFSHPKALEQCTKFLKAHPGMKPIVHADTAGAAAEVAQKKDKTLAAISSEECADLYGLQVIRKNIEDEPNNYTRFFAISKRAEPGKKNKCSLMLTLKHEPSSLYRLLGLFAEENLNLTKLESRPMKQRPFEYIFSLDFEFGLQDIEKFLIKCKNQAQSFKLLGIYEKAEV